MWPTTPPGATAPHGVTNSQSHAPTTPSSISTIQAPTQPTAPSSPVPPPLFPTLGSSPPGGSSSASSVPTAHSPRTSILSVLINLITTKPEAPKCRGRSNSTAGGTLTLNTPNTSGSNSPICGSQERNNTISPLSTDKPLPLSTDRTDSDKDTPFSTSLPAPACPLEDGFAKNDTAAASQSQFISHTNHRSSPSPSPSPPAPSPPSPSLPINSILGTPKVTPPLIPLAGSISNNYCELSSIIVPPFTSRSGEGLNALFHSVVFYAQNQADTGHLHVVLPLVEIAHELLHWTGFKSDWTITPTSQLSFKSLIFNTFPIIDEHATEFTFHNRLHALVHSCNSILKSSNLETLLSCHLRHFPEKHGYIRQYNAYTTWKNLPSMDQWHLLMNHELPPRLCTERCAHKTSGSNLTDYSNDLQDEANDLASLCVILKAVFPYASVSICQSTNADSSRKKYMDFLCSLLDEYVSLLLLHTQTTNPEVASTLTPGRALPNRKNRFSPQHQIQSPCKNWDVIYWFQLLFRDYTAPGDNLFFDFENPSSRSWAPGPFKAALVIFSALETLKELSKRLQDAKDAAVKSSETGGKSAFEFVKLLDEVFIKATQLIKDTIAVVNESFTSIELTEQLHHLRNTTNNLTLKPTCNASFVRPKINFQHVLSLSRLHSTLEKERAVFFSNPGPHTQKEFSHFTLGLCDKLFAFASLLLGDAPCCVSLLMLGSSSRLDRTPFSDIEVAFISEKSCDEDKNGPSKESKYVAYVKGLFELLVKGFRETPTQDGHAEGFRLDYSTSLGDYKMGRVDDVLEKGFISDIKKDITCLDNPSTYIMLNTRLVNSETGSALFEAYNNQLTEFLDKQVEPKFWGRFLDALGLCNKYPTLVLKMPLEGVAWRHLIAVYCWATILPVANNTTSMYDVKTKFYKPLMFLAMSLKMFFCLQSAHPYDIFAEMETKLNSANMGVSWQPTSTLFQLAQFFPLTHLNKMRDLFALVTCVRLKAQEKWNLQQEIKACQEDPVLTQPLEKKGIPLLRDMTRHTEMVIHYFPLEKFFCSMLWLHFDYQMRKLAHNMTQTLQLNQEPRVNKRKKTTVVGQEQVAALSWSVHCVEECFKRVRKFEQKFMSQDSHSPVSSYNTSVFKKLRTWLKNFLLLMKIDQSHTIESAAAVDETNFSSFETTVTGQCLQVAEGLTLELNDWADSNSQRELLFKTVLGSEFNSASDCCVSPSNPTTRDLLTLVAHYFLLTSSVWRSEEEERLQYMYKALPSFQLRSHLWELIKVIFPPNSIVLHKLSALLAACPSSNGFRPGVAETRAQFEESLLHLLTENPLSLNQQLPESELGILPVSLLRRSSAPDLPPIKITCANLDAQHLVPERSQLESSRETLHFAGFTLKTSGVLKESVAHQLSAIPMKLSSQKSRCADDRHSHLVLHITADTPDPPLPAEDDSAEQLSFFLKVFPELPAYEIAVSKLSELVIGYGTSHSVLAKLELPQSQFSSRDEASLPSEGHPLCYPVLLSEEVPGKNFEQVLQEDPNPRLHSKVFSQLVLMQLLSPPEDSKPSHFLFCKTPPSTLSPLPLSFKGGPGSAWLVGVDSDRTFGRLVVSEGVLTTPPFMTKSILFCMSQMTEPLERSAVREFLCLNPKEVLDHWLEDMVALHSRIQEEVQFDSSYLSEWTRELGSLQVSDYFNQSSLPVIHLPIQVVEEVHGNMVLLQSELKQNKQATPLQLLELISPPFVSSFYQRMHKEARFSTAKARFEEITQQYYSAVSSASSGTPMHALLSSSFTEQTRLEVVLAQGGSDLLKCIDRLDQLTKQFQLLGALKLQIEHSCEGSRSVEQQLNSIPDCFRHKVINMLDWRGKTKTPQLLKAQKEVLGLITSNRGGVPIAGKFNKLVLRGYHLLDNGILNSIIEAQHKWLTSLKIISCGNQHLKSLSFFESKANHLQSLCIESCLSLSTLNINAVNCPFLKKLVITNCLSLTLASIMAPAPLLSVLAIKYCNTQLIVTVTIQDPHNRHNKCHISVSPCEETTTSSLEPKNINMLILLAAISGKSSTAQWLQEHCMAPNPVGRTPFLLAAINGQVEVAKFLLDNGNGNMTTEKDYSGSTALLLAALGGSVTTIQWLWSNSSPLTVTDYKGRTALLLAANGGCVAAIEWLINHGAKLSERDNQGATALLHAVRRRGNMDAVKWLLEHGASMAEVDNRGRTALLHAANRGHLEAVRFLCGHGMAVAEEDREGNTALLRAALGGSVETISWLLEHGSSIKEQSRTGRTALLNAANRNNKAAVKLLVARGASLDERDEEGNTVLLNAALGGGVELIMWLVAHGRSLAEKNNLGMTPLLLAANRGHLEAVKWLVENGASLYEQDYRGETALSYASVHGNNPELIRWIRRKLAH